MIKIKSAKFIRNTIIGSLITCVLMMSYNIAAGNVGYAYEDEQEEAKSIDYIVDDAHIGNTTLKEFLEVEAENNTDILDENIESELNDKGIFDEEIKQFDDNIVDLLNEGYEYNTYVTYYELSENDNNFEDGHALDDRQVDEIIEEICSDEIKEDIEKNESIGDTFSEALGLSFTSYASQDIKLSKSGAVKQTLTIVNASKNRNGSKRVFVSYIVTWLKAPLYTHTDVFGIAIKNATPVYDTIKCKYAYTQNIQNITPDGSSIFSEERITEDIIGRTKRNSYGVAADVNLATDRYIGSTSIRFYNHVMTLSFYCTIDNEKDIKYVVPVGEYYHQKKTIGISPSYTITDKSIGISASVESYMELIKPNTSLTFYYK